MTQNSKAQTDTAAANFKRGIIVGAAFRIGRELAKVLVRKGWRVGLIARREALLRELEQKDAGSIVAVPTDVAEMDASIAAIEQLIESKLDEPCEPSSPSGSMCTK